MGSVRIHVVDDEPAVRASLARVLDQAGYQSGGEPRLLHTVRERALANLLDNAAAWSNPGQMVEVEVAGGEVVVRDHGPGIAASDLPHVLERFYRSPTVRSRPGSGLALPSSNRRRSPPADPSPPSSRPTGHQDAPPAAASEAPASTV